MHEVNIDLLREEAARLINVHVDVLEDMRTGIAMQGAGDDQSMTPQATAERIEELRGELTKLESLELVVAVIGTMKAGKSTTINAIVGTEVVPSRTEPMTTLPTLIRHTPGQVLPRLKFENARPLADLLMALADKLKAPPETTDYRSFVSAPDGERLVADVLGGRVDLLVGDGEGPSAILGFLKCINDLVRLCRLTDTPFPFDQYDEFHEFPVIEVEFAHLPEEQTIGSFALLDTPGPNEAGYAKQLKDSLRKQLRRSSALLAVVDFTQMDSEADDVVRQELLKVLSASQDPERAYVIVNKIDQRKADDTTPDVVRCRRIADKLSSQCCDSAVTVSPEHVFLVSAHGALLANQALRALKTGPLDPTQAWVRDFARCALGTAWDQEDLADAALVTRKAKRVLVESGFEAPLERVIRHGHRFAAIGSLRSALQKLASIWQDANSSLAIRSAGLERPAADLQRDLDAIENDVKQAGALEREVGALLAERMQKMKSDCREVFSASTAKLESSLQDIFGAAESQEAEEDAPSKWSIQSFLRGSKPSFRSKRKPVNEAMSRGSQDFLGRLTFDTRAEANALVKAIRKEVNSDVEAAYGDLQATIDKSKADYVRTAEELIKDRAVPLFDSVNERLSGAGYGLALTLPQLSAIEINLKEASKVSISVDRETYTRLRDQEGGLGWFKRTLDVFGADWGKDEVEEDEFRIDTQNVQQAVAATLQNAKRIFEASLDGYIKNEIEAKQATFFQELRMKLENVRSDLLAAQRDKRRSQEAQVAIICCLRAQKKSLDHEREPLKMLEAEIKALENRVLEAV